MSNHGLYELALREKGRHPVIAIGRAGVGKTYGALKAAIEGVQANKYERIVIIRPNVEDGEKLGFLPGTVREKMDPWIDPLIKLMIELGLNEGVIKSWEKNGKLEYIPVGYLRGRTFHRAFIIADEVQNMSFSQLNGIATRQGKYCKLVLCGDVKQTSERFRNSGLAELIDMLQWEDGAYTLVEFERGDDMRSDECTAWCDMLEDWEEYKEKQSERSDCTTCDGNCASCAEAASQEHIE